jgi:hypothetical protein
MAASNLACSNRFEDWRIRPSGEHGTAIWTAGYCGWLTYRLPVSGTKHSLGDSFNGIGLRSWDLTSTAPRRVTGW